MEATEAATVTVYTLADGYSRVKHPPNRGILLVALDEDAQGGHS